MFYDLIRELLPLIPGLTDEARQEFADAIDKHEAEHNAKPAPTTSKG